MRLSFKPSFSRAMALLGVLGMGLVQVGCAHPVFIEPSVAVHSRVGHFPVHAQIGLPGPVIYAPPPRVVYAPPPRVVYVPPPPPPPRVVYAPLVHSPMPGWNHAHEHRVERSDGRRFERRDDRRRPGFHGDGHR